MPIQPRQQILSTEDKFSRVIEIISKMSNPGEASLLSSFIIEICRRYIDKDKELDKYISEGIQKMNAFEREYIERIITEFQ